MKYNFWIFLWDTCEIVYTLSFRKINIFAPIELFWPHFAPWLFGKMIGRKGTRLK